MKDILFTGQPLERARPHKKSNMNFRQLIGEKCREMGDKVTESKNMENIKRQ